MKIQHGSKALIGQAPVRDIKVMTYVQRLRSSHQRSPVHSHRKMGHNYPYNFKLMSNCEAISWFPLFWYINDNRLFLGSYQTLHHRAMPYSTILFEVTALSTIYSHILIWAKVFIQLYVDRVNIWPFHDYHCSGASMTSSSQEKLKGESVVAPILPSRAKVSYCTSGFFHS